MSWKAEYAILIMIATLASYFFALQIDKTESILKKRLFLALSLSICLGILFFFKYFNFVSESVREFLNLFSVQFNSPILGVLLPVGISFYTFQIVGYTLDVYYKRIKPERHLGIFAVFVSFFPQLVAGPIERASSLIPQFFEKHHFDYKRVTDGIKLMMWGFFLKVVIADRLAILTNQVFNNVYNYTGLPLIIASYFFGYQVYCDFAGYSFIAIGAAQVMGYKLTENFKRPFFSKSFSEVWRRWHISLMNWFRNYIFFPLAFKKGANKFRLYYATVIVFFVSGLWHGAGWNFILWGLLCAFYIVISRLTSNLRGKITNMIGLSKYPTAHNFLKILITFHLWIIAAIVFRINSLQDGVYVFTHLFKNLTFMIKGLPLGLDSIGLIIAVVFIGLTEVIQLIQEKRPIRSYLSTKPTYIRWILSLGLFFSILLFGVFEGTQFVYFQF